MLLELHVNSQDANVACEVAFELTGAVEFMCYAVGNGTLIGHLLETKQERSCYFIYRQVCLRGTVTTTTVTI